LNFSPDHFPFHLFFFLAAAATNRSPQLSYFVDMRRKISPKTGHFHIFLDFKT